jgi:hypothetical protein
MPNHLKHQKERHDIMNKRQAQGILHSEERLAEGDIRADLHADPHDTGTDRTFTGSTEITHPYNEPDERVKHIIEYLRQTGWEEEKPSEGNDTIWCKPETNGEILIKRNIDDEDIPDVLSNLAQGNRTTVFQVSRSTGIPYQTGMRTPSDMERQCIMEWINDFCQRAYSHEPDIDLPQEADRLLQLSALEHAAAEFR